MARESTAISNLLQLLRTKPLEPIAPPERPSLPRQVLGPSPYVIIPSLRTQATTRVRRSPRVGIRQLALLTGLFVVTMVLLSIVLAKRDTAQAAAIAEKPTPKPIVTPIEPKLTVTPIEEPPSAVTPATPVAEPVATKRAAKRASKGVLSIRSERPHQIWIDGRNTQETTPERLRLSPGTHRVTLVDKKTRKATTYRVEIRSKRVARLRV